MYDLLNLTKNPFQITNDVVFFCSIPEHRAALDSLVMSINECAGLNVIYGDYGTGKSTIMAVIASKFTNNDKCVLVNMGCVVAKRSAEFYRRLLLAAGRECVAHDCARLRQSVEEWAVDKALGEGKFILILVDEAQELSLSCLDAIRTLVNYELRGHKMFHFVLFGQMMLLDKVRKRKNLADRINFSMILKNLSKEAMIQMLHYRIKVVSQNQESPIKLFTPEALDLIWKYSKGFPRRALILCDHLLKDLLAGNNTTAIDGAQVFRVAAAMVKMYGSRENS